MPFNIEQPVRDTRTGETGRYRGVPRALRGTRFQEVPEKALVRFDSRPYERRYSAHVLDVNFLEAI